MIDNLNERTTTFNFTKPKSFSKAIKAVWICFAVPPEKQKDQ